MACQAFSVVGELAVWLPFWTTKVPQEALAARSLSFQQQHKNHLQSRIDVTGAGARQEAAAAPGHVSGTVAGYSSILAWIQVPVSPAGKGRLLHNPGAGGGGVCHI